MLRRARARGHPIFAQPGRQRSSGRAYNVISSTVPIPPFPMILVTGGAGFIGSNFVLDWLAQSDEPVVNFDKLTYAGNLDNLASLERDARHVFVQGDIGDGAYVARLLEQYRPRAIVHLAAESHVDRSIDSPAAFIATNVNGTFALL